MRRVMVEAAVGWLVLLAAVLLWPATGVHAFTCGNPLLQRHCVFMPGLTGPDGRGCERLTGDAFDDSTAWRLVKPSRGGASLETSATLTGGVGVRLDPDIEDRVDVSVQSVATFPLEFSRQLWLTLWYRKIAGSEGQFSDLFDAFRGCVIPDTLSESGGFAGCWSVKPPSAVTTWTHVVENMDDEARQWRPTDLRMAVEADGDTAWEVDDAALWACKPGERPR